MNGNECSAFLKKNEHLKSIPIVAITGSALKENMDYILQTCEGNLGKPVIKSDLIVEIMKYPKHEDQMEKRKY